jgi:peptide/nickel transport system substrate-binding protein
VELSGGIARDSFLFPPTGEGAPSTPDLVTAKRLIAKAGVAAPAVCILFDPSNPRRLQEFDLLKQSAEKAGFVVSDCSASDWQGFLGVPNAYDAALFAWNETTTAVSAPEARLLSTSTVSNFSQYASATVDGLLAELAVADDEQRQQALLEQIDAQLAEDSYGMPLYQFATVVAHRDGIEGISPSPLSGLLWNIWQWQPVAAGT